MGRTRDGRGRNRERAGVHRAGGKAPATLKTLDRVLSRAGAGSRTQGAGWIRRGRVTVNGRTERDPLRWVDPRRDRVALDGRRLEPEAGERRYVLFYKPKGCLTTRTDPAGRKTVFDLLPAGLP